MTASLPTRRFGRFSLRTLFVAVVGFALLLGVIGQRLSRWRHDVATNRQIQAAVVALKPFQLRIRQTTANGEPNWSQNIDNAYYATTPVCAVWQNHSHLVTPLKTCLYLGLENSAVTDRDLVHLRAWSKSRQFTALNLANTSITDDGLKLVQEHTELRFLALDGTQITDDGLQHLTKLTGLRFLSLKQTAITAAGVSVLNRQLPHCWVSIDSPPAAANLSASETSQSPAASAASFAGSGGRLDECCW